MTRDYNYYLKAIPYKKIEKKSFCNSKVINEGGKSAPKVTKEIGIDTNTVCRREGEYREAKKYPHNPNCRL